MFKNVLNKINKINKVSSKQMINIMDKQIFTNTNKKYKVS